MIFDYVFDKNTQLLNDKFKNLSNFCNFLSPVQHSGKVIKATGTIVTASINKVKIGDLCEINDDSIGLKLKAEVLALDGNNVTLLPFGSISNISKNTIVGKLSDQFTIKISDSILGKIIDGFGNVIDSLAKNDLNTINSTEFYYSVMQAAPNSLLRPLISKPLITGIKAIDLFTTCGEGQRIAIFAGPGMGKTTLIGMITRNTEADVIVIGLIGERGREVREFIDIELGEEAKKKCVLVVVTSDKPPSEQVKAAYVAQTIAEYFRDKGKKVIIFMDSITRFARAQREVGLSAGELSTRQGFPPSVFLSFPKLMERAGNNEYGSITAFYTVLLEDELAHNDPVAEEVRSIVDGHIILSRKLSEEGHFPAINVLASLSRVADRIIQKEHINVTRKIRLLLSKFNELEFLIRVGEYKTGHDKLADEAISKHKNIMKFLQQGIYEKTDFYDSFNKLKDLAR